MATKQKRLRGADRERNRMAHRKSCPECGQPRLTRSKRRGFWEKWVMAFFGRYPWKCKACKTRVMIKDRGIMRHKETDGTIRESRRAHS